MSIDLISGITDFKLGKIPPRLIAEMGSTHMGKLERIQEAAIVCQKLGIDHLKLQLFPNDDKYTKVGNVWLSHELFREAFLYGKTIGVSITASVFDLESYYFLRNLQPDFIKFSYSMKETGWMIKDCLDHGFEAIVSCDVMTDHLVDPRATKLYCIPEYPVRYEVAFDELFKPKIPNKEMIPQMNYYRQRFDGFSDHTLGMRQTKRAIEAGAEIIEKHVRLGYDDENCPDARFAVTIQEFGGVK